MAHSVGANSDWFVGAGCSELSCCVTPESECKRNQLQLHPALSQLPTLPHASSTIDATCSDVSTRTNDALLSLIVTAAACSRLVTD